MADALDEVAELDRRWFRAHRDRHHRCRFPYLSELELYDSEHRARLVMAICHLGRGRVVSQPVIFQGALAAEEGSAATLFALAAGYPQPTLSSARWSMSEHHTERAEERHVGLSKLLRDASTSNRRPSAAGGDGDAVGCRRSRAWKAFCPSRCGPGAGVEANVGSIFGDRGGISSKCSPTVASAAVPFISTEFTASSPA